MAFRFMIHLLLGYLAASLRWHGMFCSSLDFVSIVGLFVCSDDTRRAYGSSANVLR